MRIIVFACVLGLELGITAYVSYAAWLLSAWLVDARFALNARTWEWWIEGLRRVALFSVVAGFVAVASDLVNLILSHYLASVPAPALRAIAALQLTLILGGSVVGGAWFVWRRPFA